MMNDAIRSPKGLPWNATQSPSDATLKGWNILDGSCFMPVMTLRSSALRNNIEVMAEYCRREGVTLAPHGKTTMSPELFRLQIDAGSWALTAATPWQVASMFDMGHRRIILANVLVERSGIQWVADALQRTPDFDFYCYVDSLDSLVVLEQELERCGFAGTVKVLIEFGHSPGRTGVRTVEKGLEIADRLSRSSVLSLVGVAGFEGLISVPSGGDLSAVDSFLLGLRELAEQIDLHGGFIGIDEVILSAGGSAYFDRVVSVLRPTKLSPPSRIVLRSGCYVSHDSQLYEKSSPLAGRRSLEESLHLVPALELWATVWSRPEPDLAIVGFGRRDTSYDSGLPMPLRVHEVGGVERPLAAGAEIVALNDQHAFLRLPAEDALRVGDVVVFGISHPCTAFERWRQLPVIDDDFTVQEMVTTVF